MHRPIPTSPDFAGNVPITFSGIARNLPITFMGDARNVPITFRVTCTSPPHGGEPR